MKQQTLLRNQQECLHMHFWSATHLIISCVELCLVAILVLLLLQKRNNIYIYILLRFCKKSE